MQVMQVMQSHNGQYLNDWKQTETFTQVTSLLTLIMLLRDW